MDIKLNPGINFSSKSEYKNVHSYINEKRMLDTFIKAVKVDTASDEDLSDIKCPTTDSQLILAKNLAEELKDIGLSDVEIDDNGFLTAVLPSNIENAPTVGFLAHMDTSPDCKSGPVKPIVHNYKGGDIKLNGVTIKEDELKKYKDHTIITSDGTTLLGGDDKAGIAEIIEALRVFMEHPELKRPEIKIAFTPDEELGTGIEHFDIDKFRADVAYTVDGTNPDSVDTETFNAYNPIIKIKGVPTHYGFAYGKMINSILIANDLINMLPKNETPETTKEKEGYYCVDKISGGPEETRVKLVVRDFDADRMSERLNFVENVVEELRKKYPEAEIQYNENPVYKNMKTYIEKTPEIIKYTKEGLKLSGFVPKQTYIRGGTDGADISSRGLPCPNIGSGEINFHSRKELVSLEVMKKCCENILNIAQVWANEKNPFNK